VGERSGSFHEERDMFYTCLLFRVITALLKGGKYRRGGIPFLFFILSP
jgi:hypothetical protein